MDGLPVTFLCYWGGNILNPSNGCEYDIPPKRPLRANSRWSYQKLLTELYRVTGLNKRDFRLGVICRYPISFDRGTANYIVLPVNDNSGVEAMFDVFTHFSGIGSLQLYLEINPIDSQGFANDTEVGGHYVGDTEVGGHYVGDTEVGGHYVGNTEVGGHYVGDTVDSRVDEGNLNYSTSYHDLGNPVPLTFQSDAVTTTQIVHTNVSPPRPRNVSGLNEDLETDSEDDEEMFEHRLTQEDNGSSSSSSDNEETDIGNNIMDVNDCQFYREIGEGSYITDIRASQVQLSEGDELGKGLLFRSKNDMQCEQRIGGTRYRRALIKHG